MISYIFDGSFAGLCCCIFRAYAFKDRQLQDRKRQDKQIRIYSHVDFQPELFGYNADEHIGLAEEVVITTDEAKAQRVWTALTRKIGSSSSRRVYFAFLSEQAQSFQHIFDFACYVFDHQQAVADNYGHPAVLGISQIAKSVSREKHRMEAFVRFKKTAEDIFFAVIDPDFNVLPLISPHFKGRYADQRWLIYDEKRRYGLFYDLSRVHEVQLSNTHNKSMIEQAKLTDTSITLDAQEALYDQLWKDYFKSTNIVERRNIKLHVQHVPKRYWKYLTEKN
ncbi:MAG: DNA metabolism protein [Moraxellaceae bacterium]|nr:MAG: DNA metabolism protein [Moraxellaceae bacterium]